MVRKFNQVVISGLGGIMKKISLVFILVLLISVFQAHPVNAEPSSSGYLPLLREGYDISLPREISSRQAYDSILPELLKAQNSGGILSFEVDYYGGFVRLTLPPVASQNIGGLEVRDSLSDVLVRPLQFDQAYLKAPPGVYISLNAYSSCFYVYGVSTSTHISGQLFTSTAELVGAADGFSDTELYYWDCFDGSKPTVKPGYSVQFQVDIAGGPPVIYTTTVPQNTFKTITKSTASVTGTATPALPYALDWYHALLDSENHYRMLREEGTIPLTGNWSETYADKFRGGDHLVLILETDTVFHTNTALDVPYFSCTLRSPDCIYHGFPRKPVTMTITHAGTPYTFSGTTNRQGEFTISLEDSMGNPLKLSPGDLVTATSTLKETLPDLTASVNRTTDKITGKAPLYNYFNVELTPYLTGVTSRDWVKASLLGKYRADFSAVGIPDTGSLKVELVYAPKRSGNVTRLIKIVP
jgi:hypothetical protein